MATIRKRGKSYQIDYFDPSKNRIRKSFAKRKDAEAELGKRVSLIAEGRYLDVKKECVTTLKDLVLKYEETYRDQPSFISGKRFHLNVIRNHFGDETIISNIRYGEIEVFRNKYKNGLTRAMRIRSVASVNRVMSCLRHLFRKAVEWELIEQNPFSRGKCLILKENNTRLRYLSQDEIARLLDACSTRVIKFPNKRGHIQQMTRKDPDYLREIVECALLTGMRKQEILSLKWEQIRNGFIYLAKTKTNESRQIPIGDHLDRLFKRIRLRNELKSPYVFTCSGTHVKDIKTAFNAAVKRAELVDFRFHDLRHTFASQLIMRGGSLKDVQELLGHKSMTMTLRYAHLSQEHKKRAVNLLNGLTECPGGETVSSAEEERDCHKHVTNPFHATGS